MKTLELVVAAVTLMAGAQAAAHGRLADVFVYVVGKPGHEYVDPKWVTDDGRVKNSGRVN